MVSSTTAGRIMVAIAALGLLVSVVGSAVAWQLVSDLDQGVRQSLALTGEVLVTVDESFVIAEDSLAILDDGVAEAEQAVRALSASMAEGEDALESVTALTGGEVADALESVEQSLPAIQAAADAIDGTLEALNALPLALRYEPEQPLAATIGELRRQLGGLPDELREQAAQVERMSEELSAATAGTEATADSLSTLQERLDAASDLVGDYARRTGEAAELVDAQRDVLATSASRARIMIVAFGLIFALSQFVPLHHGLALLGRDVTGQA